MSQHVRCSESKSLVPTDADVLVYGGTPAGVAAAVQAARMGKPVVLVEPGLAKDEFVDNGNWPHQLYVREARRMVSDYVMTEQNCFGQHVAQDSIGLGTLPMDSHNTQRYVDKHGHVRNEGNVQTQGVKVEGNVAFPPYAISSRAIMKCRPDMIRGLSGLVSP